MSTPTPLKAIRANCLDCSCGSYKNVRWCPATDCPLWPYRFGMRPETAAKQYGDDLMDTDRMPDSMVPLETLR